MSWPGKTKNKLVDLFQSQTKQSIYSKVLPVSRLPKLTKTELGTAKAVHNWATDRAEMQQQGMR